MEVYQKWEPVGKRPVVYHRWASEPPETLTGIWEGTTPGRYGDQGVLDRNGERVYVPLSKMLTELLAEVPVGSPVRITFSSWGRGRSGNNFRRFVVDVAVN